MAAKDAITIENSIVTTGGNTNIAVYNVTMPGSQQASQGGDAGGTAMPEQETYVYNDTQQQQPSETWSDGANAEESHLGWTRVFTPYREGLNNLLGRPDIQGRLHVANFISFSEMSRVEELRDKIEAKVLGSDILESIIFRHPFTSIPSFIDQLKVELGGTAAMDVLLDRYHETPEGRAA
eukprot:scpid95375/ scgid20146/ 